MRGDTGEALPVFGAYYEWIIQKISFDFLFTYLLKSVIIERSTVSFLIYISKTYSDLYKIKEMENFRLWQGESLWIWKIIGPLRWPLYCTWY